MRKISWSYFFLFFIIQMAALAQNSALYSSEFIEFDKAVSLYKESQYVSAQIVFENLKASKISDEMLGDCSFYSANCAIRTNQPNADLAMEKFILEFPTSSKQNLAYIDLAQFYFKQSDYQKAILWFDKVSDSDLIAGDRDRFNFQKGYSFFNSKNKKEATVYLNKVVNSAEFGSQAKYYLGYLAYEGDDYTRATKYFDAVSGDDKYKETLSYYQADMNFKLGNFQKAIDLAEKAMLKSNSLEKSELNKIIGESYFNLKQYDKAIPFLVGYKGKNGKWNNTDFYQLGYAYFEQKDFENAISQFNKIIAGNDFVAQNAYYHLGESYLNSNKKQQALNAFKNASEMEFDASIQEDAGFNYAKLSYELGNSYQSVPLILTNFLKKHPNNAANLEIEKLLIDSYISSKNYKEALVLLENSKTTANKLAYQKVCFYRGLELYTNEDYDQAFLFFEKSISEDKNAIFTARAYFWKAATAYILNDFKNALTTFKQFQILAQAKEVQEYKNSNYNIAYTYFKLKEYEQAGNYFESQISISKQDNLRLNDSYLRLADCRFVTSKYVLAMEAYSKVIESKSVDADYAYFQRAISYGFISKNKQKIESLISFLSLFPKSDYRDDALFELGNTYVAENSDDLAIKTYDRLNSEFKKGSFTSKAILRQGLVYYNSDKDDLALVKFKKVAADFPKSAEALEAVATARLIYVDNGKVDEYATWVRSLDFVSVTDAELDNDTFEAAEKQFQQNNLKQAISGFSAYITRFPKGIHALKANYFLGQSYFLEGFESKSIPNYEFVIGEARNEFTEFSLARLADIYLKNKVTNAGISVLLRLENEADLVQNKTFAQANLMKLYYENKDFVNAVLYAEKSIVNPKTENEVKIDAQIIIARAAIQTADFDKAQVAYAKLLPIAKGELAAEALYYDGYFKNKEGKFEDSNVAIQKLAKNYSSYNYFGAKGLLVMAKNFYSLKDSFQATYILDNVIKNFTEFPELVTEAQTELDRIKTEEGKTNSSITN